MKILFLAALTVLLALSESAAQPPRFRGGGRFFRDPFACQSRCAGRLSCCRFAFRQIPAGDGGGWAFDYRKAVVHLAFRISELTTGSVSRAPEPAFQHVVLLLDDPTIARCPF